MSAESTQKFSAFKWTKRRADAAVLLAEDELTDSEIAARVGIHRRALAKWKQRPEFVARVEELVQEMGDAARRYAIARRNRRIQGYDDRRGRLLDLVDARAAEHAAAPGGATGLIVRTQKSIGGGSAAQVVDEYAIDAALLKELRELEKQAAIEAGQWTEKHEHSVSELDRALAAELGRLTTRRSAALPADASRVGTDDPQSTTQGTGP